MADEKTVQGTVTLSHVDPAPAQTWNWLAVNETSLEVPVADSVAARLAGGVAMGDLVDTEVPDDACGIVMSAGTQATAWVDAGATERTVVRVPDGTDGGTVTVPCLSPDGTLAQTTVVVGADASAEVRVLALGDEA